MNDEPTQPATEPAPPRALWLPRDLAIASALLGFPGGFGLAARNAWRLGRRATAWALLLVGAAIVMAMVFLLPEDLPRGAVIGVNLAVVAGLVLIVRQQVRDGARDGRAVDRASAGGGIATFAGGWLATAGPAVLVVLVLTFLGSQVQSMLAGTVQFGTAGVDCEVEERASALPAAGPVHYVATLSRDVGAGETIHFTLRRGAGTEIYSEDLGVDTTATCVSGTIPPGTLSAGAYVLEFTTGAERLAMGEVTLTGP